ncbi:MAG TPA: restriction endonuclease subunit S [Patescibacteria group bacterium]|nr:restriction endonuclease subunit S [Patescibacteria group bacterium]
MVQKLQNKNWRKVKLEGLLDLIIDHRGKTPKKMGGGWSISGVPAISAKNIKNGRIVNENDIRYVNRDLYEKWMTNKLEVGDLLLTSEAPLGELFYIKNKIELCLSQRLFALRTNSKKLNSLFLYYYLLSPEGRHELMRRLSGTAAEGIRQAELRQIEIFSPEDVGEQKRIAEILSAFDEKIELNNKVNQNLEQMAQAIFKEWFVKFKFPGHEKVKMVDSELGEIPEGWEVKKIGNVAKINKGLSYSSEEIRENNGGTPMINLSNFVRGGGFKIEGIKFFNGKYKDSNLVESGDVVVALTDLTSNREVIGHPARVPEIKGWDKILISLDVCSIKTQDVLKTFLYYLMLRRNFSYFMASSASGTNVSHLSQSVISDYSFVLPSNKVLTNFFDLIKPIFYRVNKLSSENQKLASLRDLFLPKLMKGEIKI